MSKFLCFVAGVIGCAIGYKAYDYITKKNDNMDTVDYRTFKEKVDDIKGRAEVKAKAISDWAKLHADEILVASAVVIPVVTKGAHEINKAKANREEKIHRERDIYDPRKGRTYRCKRTPKQWEYDEIDARYDAGENYSHILRDMHLI